jgi:hypothetical protein
MALLLAGLTAVVLACGVLLRTLGLFRGIGLAVALPVLTLACNPLCLRLYHEITMLRIAIPWGVESPLGFAYCWRGLGGLWVNEYWALDDVMRQKQTLALGVALTVLAAAGLVCLGGRWLGLAARARRGDVAFRGRCVLAAGILALALVPLYVWSKGLYVYQFLKLTLTVSPLLALAVAHAWDWLPLPQLRGGLAGLSLAVLLTTGVSGTAALTSAAGRQHPPLPRSVQHITLFSEWRQACARLASLKGRNVVLAAGPGIFHNGWFAYAAKDNNVWLVNPALMEGTIIATYPKNPLLIGVPQGIVYDAEEGRFYIPKPLQLIDLDHLPAEALLFTGDLAGVQVRAEGDCRLLWSNVHFQLWQLGPGPYTLHPTAAAGRGPK